MSEEPSNDHDTQIAVIMSELRHIQHSILEIKKMIEQQAKNYVTQDQFKPVRDIVYRGAGLVLTAALAAGIALIWKT